MAAASQLHLLGSRLNLNHLIEASKQDLVRLLGNPDKKKVSLSRPEKFADLPVTITLPSLPGVSLGQ